MSIQKDTKVQIFIKTKYKSEFRHYDQHSRKQANKQKNR